jgi:hemolysin activation/secretion protein
MTKRVLLLLTGLLLSGALHAQVLPPPPESQERLANSPRLLVRKFEFEGNRAFSDAELSRVTSSFTNRPIGIEELELARRAISLFYVNHGFVNSGALIPDQDPTNGIVRIRIVEGVLTGIELSGNRWLRDDYLKSRLQRGAGPPLNLNELQDGLQLLRNNPNVRQINAELRPGTAPGEAVLDVRAVDQHPFQLGLQADNQRPPSVGAEQLWALISDQNLTGNSDRLDLKYGIATAGADDDVEFSGVDNLEGRYALPLNRYDTTLGLQASRLNSALVEEDFLPLDIESLTTSYGVVLRQPVYQTARREFALSIGFDHRRNESFLLGEPFDLSPGSVSGETKVSVLRLSQEWLDRGPNHVLALRSTFNVGLDILDATHSRAVAPPGIDTVNRGFSNPDAKFFSWIGQVQYVRRLFSTQNELILRVAGQYTDEPLLALEQFSVGGSETVRGYLENQLVRDRALVSSVGVRVPVLFNKAGAGIVHLVPFYDFGGAWNVERRARPETISSVGMGLQVAPNKHVSAQLYWGKRLRNVDVPDDSGLQEHGIHFKVSVMAF